MTTETARLKLETAALETAAIKAEEAEDWLEDAAGHAELTPERAEKIWALKLELNRLVGEIEALVEVRRLPVTPTDREGEMEIDKGTGPQRPKVGISLLVVAEVGLETPRILLGKRRGSHGHGQYGTPGGHLEHGESYEEAALREFREECGDSPVITAPRFLCVTNLREYLPKHYTDIGMVVRHQGGMPKTTEPDKCDGWRWFPIDEMPFPRFSVVENLVIAYMTGQTYFQD